MLSSKGFNTEDRLSAASGGNNTYTYSDASGDYKIHKFTADGTLTINLPMPLDILVVAGGGSGGGTGARGAGGAGGLRWFTDQHLVSGAYVCTIGAGGGDPPASDTVGNNGANSSFVKSGTISISATGGGAGGGDASAPQKNGNTGGSSGGTNWDGTATAGNAGNYTPVEGYGGGNASTSGSYGGGGGGGAGGAAGNGSPSAGGDGGVGEDNFLNQSSAAFTQAKTTAFLSAASAGELVSGVRYIAGGGGGGLYTSGSAKAGGHGGGGDGGYGASTAGTNGTANTGGGGGGGSNTVKGGQGGSGIVIIRYRLH